MSFCLEYDKGARVVIRTSCRAQNQSAGVHKIFPSSSDFILTVCNMALHAAAREGNLDELQRLIGNIKYLNARDKHHRTALVMASWAGQAGSCTCRTRVILLFITIIGVDAQRVFPPLWTGCRHAIGASTKVSFLHAGRMREGSARSWSKHQSLCNG